MDVNKQNNPFLLILVYVDPFVFYIAFLLRLFGMSVMTFSFHLAIRM
jgi:hypothetical protein